MSKEYEEFKPFKPTWLYVKRHSVTGLMYFGKTCSKDPYKYTGSGKRWKRHINKHGKEFIETVWVELFSDVDELIEFAIFFSEFHDIVQSNKWANFIIETGLDGGSHISPTPCIHCGVICHTLFHLYQYHGENCMQNPEGVSQARAKNNKTRSDLMKAARNNEPIIECEHCNSKTKEPHYIRYHGVNCINNPILSDTTNLRIIQKEFKKVENGEKYQQLCFEKRQNREAAPDLTCIYCGYTCKATNSNNFYQHHSDNCRQNPAVSDKILQNNINRANANKKMQLEKPLETCEFCGFVGKGLNMSKYHHAKCKQSPTYVKIVRTNINLNGVVKNVKPNELQHYLDEGWEIGAKRKPYNSGTVCINNGKDRLYIEESNLQHYLDEGWIKGIKIKRIE